MAVYDTLLNKLYPGLPLAPIDIVITIASSLGLLICAILIPLLFCFGTRTASSIIGCFTFTLLIALYVYCMFGDISFFTQDNFPERLMLWIMKHKRAVITGIHILPILGIAGTFASYLLVVKRRLIKGIR